MACFIIAEIGVNHNGSLALAKQLVDQAKLAGVDAVKFQTFKANLLVTKDAKKASYQLETTDKNESQLSMLERLELSYDDHAHLLDYCQKLDIQFLSTPFDFTSLAFLVDDLGLTQLKVSSGDLTNAPMLLAFAHSGCDLIISSGMASLAEITLSLGVLAFGLLQANGQCNDLTPSTAAFARAYQSVAGQKLLTEKVILLHCTTDYPASPSDINLRAMDTLAKEFNLAIGYSDHSLGNVIPVAAVALGAVVIEKHITLDRNSPGPDHRASIEIDELTCLVSEIRLLEKALGSGIKQAAKSEQKNKVIARKSLVALTKISKGECFTAANVTTKRPGNGMSPYDYWQLLETKASSNYHEGDLINESL